MKVDRIFINTHKYDFHLAKVCIASIRYWYPEIPIYLIKELNLGSFSTEFVEDFWKVLILDISRKKFGWGFGKLEPLFLDGNFSFLALDADTVITGPVLDLVTTINSQFVVDKEVQPAERFNQIYYSLEKISSIEEKFLYPGYSFNTGQWFGTCGLIKREDFDKCLIWTEPAKIIHPNIFFNGDQGAFNFVLQWLEQQNRLTVEKISLMIWPNGADADDIDLNDIKNRRGNFPNIIHWAGISFNNIRKVRRLDIHNFYKGYYYSKTGKTQFWFDSLSETILALNRKINLLKTRLKMNK